MLVFYIFDLCHRCRSSIRIAHLLLQLYCAATTVRSNFTPYNCLLVIFIYNPSIRTILSTIVQFMMLRITLFSNSVIDIHYIDNLKK